MTKAESLMSQNLVTISKSASLLDAQKLMKELRIRHLPVVDEEDAIVGILSQRDLIYLDDMDEVAVECVMSAPVFAVDHNLNLKNVVYKLIEKKISSALIKDDNNHAVGIITTDDLLWYLAHLLDKEETESKSILAASNLIKVGEIAQVISNAGI